MTAAERQRLRHLRDQAVRDQLAESGAIQALERECCRRCGGPLDGRTPGCQTCAMRHRHRKGRTIHEHHHGTMNGYRYGCRCDRYRRANTLYRRHQRAVAAGAIVA